MQKKAVGRKWIYVWNLQDNVITGRQISNLRANGKKHFTSGVHVNSWNCGQTLPFDIRPWKMCQPAALLSLMPVQWSHFKDKDFY